MRNTIIHRLHPILNHVATSERPIKSRKMVVCSVYSLSNLTLSSRTTAGPSMSTCPPLFLFILAFYGLFNVSIALVVSGTTTKPGFQRAETSFFNYNESKNKCQELLLIFLSYKTLKLGVSALVSVSLCIHSTFNFRPSPL